MISKIRLLRQARPLLVAAQNLTFPRNKSAALAVIAIAAPVLSFMAGQVRAETTDAALDTFTLMQHEYTPDGTYIANQHHAFPEDWGHFTGATSFKGGSVAGILYDISGHLDLIMAGERTPFKTVPTTSDVTGITDVLPTYEGMGADFVITDSDTDYFYRILEGFDVEFIILPKFSTRV